MLAALTPALQPSHLRSSQLFIPLLTPATTTVYWTIHGRATNNINAFSQKVRHTSVTWRGWYRLFINGLSAQIPDTCVEKAGCGTDIPLWIRDGHPSLQDGVVTRDVCGPWKNYCCFYGSYPIKVKACPGNYYVYELITPTYCNYSYCAAVTNISSTDTTVTPKTTTAGNVV
ncbi:uromodulin-like [Cyprinus carpio]|uniref:Uromodulin-like n=1 Tax=Cyprinus carpio TaxID=7962 RepID=A0A9Q9YK10_CYPCA|nr:uromodulin-like [Cyprinus carpio]